MNYIPQKFRGPFLKTTTTPTGQCASSKHFRKAVQVCVLGANTPLGRFTSFLLKQNPIVSVLKLHGEQRIDDLAQELNIIDTKCKVQSFAAACDVPKAMRAADIILILASKVLKQDTSLADRVLEEGKRVYEIAKDATVYSPRSLIVVAVPPVSVFTSVVEEVFKQTDWYHPGRIVGAAATAQIKANSLLARNQDLDPQICHVPIVGGPDVEIAVPLFSRAKPIELNDRAAQPLLAQFRGIRPDEFPHKRSSREDYVESVPMSEAFALNSMIHRIGLGVCGDEQSYYNCYVRSNAIKTTCRHLVTTLQFSQGGVVHNYGLPELTSLELELLEKATLRIKEREKIASDLIEFLERGCDEVPPFKMKEMKRKQALAQKVIR